jgi:hypothetical protein
MGSAFQRFKHLNAKPIEDWKSSIQPQTFTSSKACEATALKPLEEIEPVSSVSELMSNGESVLSGPMTSRILSISKSSTITEEEMEWLDQQSIRARFFVKNSTNGAFQPLKRAARFTSQQIVSAKFSRERGRSLRTPLFGLVFGWERDQTSG